MGFGGEVVLKTSGKARAGKGCAERKKNARILPVYHRAAAKPLRPKPSSLSGKGAIQPIKLTLELIDTEERSFSLPDPGWAEVPPTASRNSWIGLCENNLFYREI